MLSVPAGLFLHSLMILKSQVPSLASPGKTEGPGKTVVGDSGESLRVKRKQH